MDFTQNADEMTDTEKIYGLALNGRGEWFLAHSSGLARSGDQGVSWQDAYGDLFKGSPMPTTALAYHPETQTILSGVPGGILLSRDGGASWTISQLPDPAPIITGLCFSPGFSEDGTMFAASAEDGLFSARDGGTGWVAWNFGLLDASLYSLAVSPDYRVNRTVYAGSSSGLFRSRNGGYSWTALDLPEGPDTVSSLAVAKETILAGCETAGLFLSRDDGNHWTRSSGLSAQTEITGLTCDPAAPGRVYCLCGEQIFRSEDGGVHFTCIDPGSTAALFCRQSELWAAANGLKVRRVS